MHARGARLRFPSRSFPLAALVFAALIPGCAAERGPRTARVPVTVAVAEERTMPYALVATGTVEPLQTAAVGSQVGGVVTRVAFREGDTVERGQLLIQVDPRPFQAALDQARAALARSRAQAHTARLDAERSRSLYEQKLLSEAEWDQKRNAAETGDANMLADSANMRTARLNLEYASIRAPISGRTGQVLVNPGDYVRAATSEPLVTINQVRPVRVSFTVPVSAVPLVQRHRGGHPRVIVRPSRGDSVTYQGALTFVDNAVDPASGTLRLKGEFANADGRLVPGQFVDVRLVLFDQLRATVIPAPAVTNGQQGAFVYVLNADSTVATRAVTVDRTVDELAIVKDGLKPGETVITDGQLRLSPGARVLVRSGLGEGL